MDHISYSGVNQFCGCPRQHYYSRIAKLPQAPVYNLTYGSAAHYALEQCNINRMAGKPEPSRVELEQFAYGAIEADIGDRVADFKPGPMASEISAIVEDWKHWEDRGPTPTAAEYEAKRQITDTIEVVAKIDYTLSETVIGDYKTSKYGWKDIDVGFEKQPAYYSWVIGRPLTTWFEILIKAEKRDGIQFQKFKVNTTRSDMEAAHQEMLDYIEHRTSKVRNRKNYCSTCPFVTPCLNNEGVGLIQLGA